MNPWVVSRSPIRWNIPRTYRPHFRFSDQIYILKWRARARARVRAGRFGLSARDREYKRERKFPSSQPAPAFPSNRVTAQFTMARARPDGECRNSSAVAVTHRLRLGKAIPATYINELVVNLATYARNSRRVLCRARGIMGFYYMCIYICVCACACRKYIDAYSTKYTRTYIHVDAVSYVSPANIYKIYADVCTCTCRTCAPASKHTRVYDLEVAGSEVTPAHDPTVHQSPLL